MTSCVSTCAVPHLWVCGWAQCHCGAFWWRLPCRSQYERHSQLGQAARYLGPGKPLLVSDSFRQSLHLPPVKTHNLDKTNNKAAIDDSEMNKGTLQVTVIFIHYYKAPVIKHTTHFDKCISNDFPLLFWVGGHIQSLADAFSWCPVLLRNWEGRGSVVESVSCIYHWIEF